MSVHENTKEISSRISNYYYQILCGLPFANAKTKTVSIYGYKYTITIYYIIISRYSQSFKAGVFLSAYLNIMIFKIQNTRDEFFRHFFVTRILISCIRVYYTIKSRKCSIFLSYFL